MSAYRSFLHKTGRILAAFLPLTWLGACNQAEATDIRIATFNIAMGLEAHGDLGRALSAGSDKRLQLLAQILQRVRPDIILLNEFDYDPTLDAAALFNRNYLARSHDGLTAIQYPYSFRAPVNTGLDSGLDLNGDGKTAGPADAWGFGQFPGQYGMLVLSRYPIATDRVRTFQKLRWASMPGAKRPMNPDGSSFYPEDVWQQLRLSSKSHWDIPVEISGRDLHLLALHPTPPVFDGPENRNGKRNYDEIRLWAEYISGSIPGFPVDDQGKAGGLARDAAFVIAGDLNADPLDGDSEPGAIAQLLDNDRIDSHCVPLSTGAAEAARAQAGVNTQHRTDPAADTADFNDKHTGNLRLDYVLPSAGLKIRKCGVFWPAGGEAGHDLIEASDHRLVWLDIVY